VFWLVCILTSRPVLRIHDDMLRMPHKKYTNNQEKASVSG